MPNLCTHRLRGPNSTDHLTRGVCHKQKIGTLGAVRLYWIDQSNESRAAAKWLGHARTGSKPVIKRLSTVSCGEHSLTID